jgi:hypothetical protein
MPSGETSGAGLTRPPRYPPNPYTGQPETERVPSTRGGSPDAPLLVSMASLPGGPRKTAQRVRRHNDGHRVPRRIGDVETQGLVGS